MSKKQLKAETIVARLFAAMTARKQALLDGGFVVSTEITKKNGLLDNFNPEGNSYRQFLLAVEGTRNIFDYTTLLNIAAKAKQETANDANYIQCKTFEKIVKCVKAFGFKDARMLDTHSRAIIINTLVNNGVITSKNAFATLVKVEFDALDTQQTLKERHNYTPGTGSTQLSSTREMLRVLGLTDGNKGARDAAIELLPEAKQALLEHFDTIAKRVGAPVADEPHDEPATEEQE